MISGSQTRIQSGRVGAMLGRARCKGTPVTVSGPRWFSARRATYPAPEDLVNGCTFLQCALGHHLCSHFLHIQHERVEGLLYVGLFLFFFLFGVLMFSGWRQKEMGRRHPVSNCASASSKAEPVLLPLPTQAWQFQIKKFISTPEHSPGAVGGGRAGVRF